MRILIHKNYENLSKWTAWYIAQRINSFNPTPSKPFVLGLPTGSSPIGTYKHLIELVKNGFVSFRNVVTFNMDEYVGLPEAHSQSFRFFMAQNFFNHIDIKPENINILDGNVSDLNLECQRYESKIEAVGGICLFLGGIGSNGHIAFNEPGSSLQSKTRVVSLTHETIVANSRFFGNNINEVPRTALTVGVGTIMQSKEVILIVSGNNKARALQQVVDEGVNHLFPASALRLHPNGMIVCDDDATVELKAGEVKYFKETEREELRKSFQF